MAEKKVSSDELRENALCPRQDDVQFVMQDEPKGLGHAILCARDHVLPGPVAVILPDDLVLGEPGALAEMSEAYASNPGGHLVAAMTVPREDTGKYGVLSVTGRSGPLLVANRMVEKPDPADAPSCEAVVGRYVLHESIFDHLATQAPGAGGEIQLTDAISSSAARMGLRGFRFSGQRFDCGSKAGMLRATLHVASSDPDLRAIVEEDVAPTAPRSVA